MSEEAIAFSPDQQAATLGHCFRDPQLWDQLAALGATKEWLVDPSLGALFSHLEGFKKRYQRMPRAVELLHYVKNKEEPEAVAAFERTLKRCAETSRTHGVDVLLHKLSDWAMARVVVTRGMELNKQFNAGKHDDAVRTWLDAATELRRLGVVSGVSPDKVDASVNRFRVEKARRLKDAESTLSFGVRFLDEAFRKILPNDLILIGAQSGAGKTELAKIIAQHNASQGKQVYGFFLEAEEGEVERRIKFGMLAEKWRAANPNAERGVVNYADWRHGELEQLLAPWEAEVEAEFAERYSTLHTYYRMATDFGIKELEREILAVKDTAELIVLDHIHYVDLDGDERAENAAMKRLVKKLRHLSLALNIPIVCVAHLNKAAEATLVPGQKDYHGSSDIVKIATKAIMLARASGVSTTDPNATDSPTFVRIVKTRIDSGGLLTHTALCFFDVETSSYRPDYALGKLNLNCTKWKPLEERWPRWARSATIREIIEID